MVKKKFSLFLISILLSLDGTNLWAKSKNTPAPIVKLDYSYALQKLEAKGAKPKFIRQLKARVDSRIQERVVLGNVFGFRLKPDYSGHIDDTAIHKCKIFLHINNRLLVQIEKENGVRPEVIAALLWVETRHGKMTGKYHLPSVFLNLAMADQPAMIEKTLEVLREEIPATDPQYPQLVEKVKTVSAKKAEWATNELMAIEEIQARHLTNLFHTKGSYAGAFGIPQFIPSSYLKWAKGRTPNNPINLFNTRDAIRSVGNFLSSHGWGKEAPLQRQALKEYNHSEAYVSTILSLADQIRPTEARNIAQE
ncbi:lytic murein transglycosylase [Bdellovibrionota bacterium FG-1]